MKQFLPLVRWLQDSVVLFPCLFPVSWKISSGERQGIVLLAVCFPLSFRCQAWNKQVQRDYAVSNVLVNTPIISSKPWNIADSNIPSVIRQEKFGNPTLCTIKTPSISKSSLIIKRPGQYLQNFGVCLKGAKWFKWRSITTLKNSTFLNFFFTFLWSFSNDGFTLVYNPLCPTLRETTVRSNSCQKTDKQCSNNTVVNTSKSTNLGRYFQWMKSCKHSQKIYQARTKDKVTWPLKAVKRKRNRVPNHYTFLFKLYRFRYFSVEVALRFSRLHSFYQEGEIWGAKPQ